MTMNYPSVLLLLLGIPLLLLAQFYEYSRNRQDLMKIGGFWENEQVRSIFFTKWFLGSLLLILCYVFLVLGLGGISWGEEPVEEDRVGLDIMFLVDVSYSMLAEDLEPSRLGRARELIRGLSENLPGARFGLVAFKGQPTVLLPATEDIYALENALNYLNTEVITSPGTDLEAGLRAAIGALPSGSNRHRVIVLFSDGEGLSGNITNPALDAGRTGIPVMAYGLGTVEGGSIPQSGGGVVTDAQGRTVITRLDSSSLQEIARLSRGEYFEAVGGQVPLDRVIRTLADQRGRDGFRLVSISRYRLFLGIALLLYGIHILIRHVKFRGLF